MRVLPRSATDADIKSAVVDWSELLAEGRFDAALAMFLHDPRGKWTPKKLLQAPQSVQDIVSAVQGRWMVCDYLSSLFPYWAPTDTVGMEFTAATTGGGSCGSDPGCMGGLVYFLVQGSSGLARGNGNGYQIWYSIDTSLELTLAQAPNNGTWSTSVSVSSNPRELWIEQLSYMNGPRLVAAP